MPAIGGDRPERSSVVFRGPKAVALRVNPGLCAGILGGNRRRFPPHIHTERPLYTLTAQYVQLRRTNRALRQRALLTQAEQQVGNADQEVQHHQNQAREHQGASAAAA
jgi:hypothetical protein